MASGTGGTGPGKGPRAFGALPVRGGFGGGGRGERKHRAAPPPPPGAFAPPAPPPCLLVIFGASGDLTKRKLVPALFGLFREELLPLGFAVLGASRTPHTDA